MAVTNEIRTVIEKNEYEPFGKVINHALKDGPGYTGHLADATTGLIYAQQRYYDDDIGAFPSVDQVTAESEGGTFNRYWYANGNPYRFTDPDGRESACFSVGLGCGLRPYTEAENKQLDSIASGLASFIPGVDLYRCANGSCGAGGWTMASLGAIPGGGKGIQLGLRALNTASDAVTTFRNISRAAFKAANNISDFRVSAKHLPGAGGNFAKFAEGVDINKSIAQALKSGGVRFLPNGDDAKSFIAIADMGEKIGSKGQTGIKVVVGNDGKIWTAYPTRVAGK